MSSLLRSMTSDLLEKRVNLLRGLVVTRVDTVDLGGNPLADIMLFKRKPAADGGTKMEDDTDHGDYCPECGGFLADDDVDCPSCGEPISKRVLNAKGRNAISDSDFAAVWTDSNGKKQRKLPIHDKKHVANAAARFNQTAMPADVKAKARKKLDAAKKKFGVGDDDGDVKKMAALIELYAPIRVLKFKLREKGPEGPALLARIQKVAADSVHLPAALSGYSRKKRKGKVVKMAEGGDTVLVTIVGDDYEDETPPTTGEVLVEDAASSKLWSLRWALSKSLDEILGCEDLTPEEKQSTIIQSAQEFAAAVESLVPTTVADVLKRYEEVVMAETKVTLDLKAIPEAQRGAVEAITKRCLELEKEREPLAKRVPELEAEVARLTALVPAESDEDKIKKALPEAFRKRFDSLVEKDELSEEVKKIAHLPLNGLTTAEKLAGVFVRIRKRASTEEDVAEVTRILKAAGEQARLGNILKVAGVDGDGNSQTAESATEEIEKQAKELMSKEGQKFRSLGVARAEIRKRNPMLANKEREEQRGNRRSA